MICKECSFEQDLSLAFDQTEEACDRCKAVGQWKDDNQAGSKAVVVMDDVLSLPPEELYHPLVIDALIEWADKEISAFTPDPTTKKGRKEIGSFARKIGSTRAAVDSHRKSTVDGWTQKTKSVNSEAKRFKDFCELKRDEVLSSREEWQKKEDKRIADEDLAEQVETAHGEAIAENDLFNRQKEVERKEQAMEMAEAAKAAKELAAKEEAERLAAEAKEKEELAARNEKIRAEAEQKAKDEAGQKIADAKAKIEQAKVDKIASAKKAEEEKDAAVAEAKRQAALQAKDLAEKAELDRLAKETAERLEREAAEKKAANKKHRAAIDKEIIAAIMSVGTIAEGQAKALVESIAKGDFTHVSINY